LKILSVNVYHEVTKAEKAPILATYTMFLVTLTRDCLFFWQRFGGLTLSGARATEYSHRDTELHRFDGGATRLSGVAGFLEFVCEISASLCLRG
jgi:hypothetical protein